MAALVFLCDYRTLCPYGWTGLATPAILLFLLLKVTGIPYAEKQALRSRGDDYRAYQAEVSPFIPLPRVNDQHLQPRTFLHLGVTHEFCHRSRRKRLGT